MKTSRNLGINYGFNHINKKEVQQKIKNNCN